MSIIHEIVDAKFGEALGNWIRGEDSARSSLPGIGPMHRVIALDSEKGPDSRCLLTRHSPDIPGFSIDGIDILAWGLEIPRREGDKRRFEDLPIEAIKGHIFTVGAHSENVIIFGEKVRSDWLSIEGLSQALSQMRVANSIPSNLE